jgi:hypothetical protein
MQSHQQLKAGKQTLFLDKMLLDMELEKQIAALAEKTRLTAKVWRVFVVEFRGVGKNQDE